MWLVIFFFFFLGGERNPLCEITVRTTAVMFVYLVSIFYWVLCDDSVFSFSLVTL